jgi:hypothetical protein
VTHLRRIGIQVATPCRAMTVAAALAAPVDGVTQW